MLLAVKVATHITKQLHPRQYRVADGHMVRIEVRKYNTGIQLAADSRASLRELASNATAIPPSYSQALQCAMPSEVYDMVSAPDVNFTHF